MFSIVSDFVAFNECRDMKRRKRRNTKSHRGHMTKFHITMLIIEIRTTQ